MKEAFKDKKLIAALSALVIVLIVFFFYGLPKIKENSINSFDDCSKFYPVQETFPERCSTPGGKLFIQPISKNVELTGSVSCLPHKNTNGPQTLECAAGLDVEGVFYGLSFKSTDDFIKASSAKTIFVRGLFTSETDPNSKYNSVGKVDVTDFVILEESTPGT